MTSLIRSPSTGLAALSTARDSAARATCKAFANVHRASGDLTVASRCVATWAAARGVPWRGGSGRHRTRCRRRRRSRRRRGRVSLCMICPSGGGSARSCSPSSITAYSSGCFSLPTGACH